MSKNELQRSGEHQRCGFANGAAERLLSAATIHKKCHPPIFAGGILLYTYVQKNDPRVADWRESNA